MTSANVEGPINQNHFQRVVTLSQLAELTILAKRSSRFPIATAMGSRILVPVFPGRLGVFLEIIRIVITQRRALRFDVVLTDPSILGLCGLAIRLAARKTKWVVDIWDIPIRCAEPKHWSVVFRGFFIKRLVRAAYRFADLFLVSIYPNLQLEWFKLPPHKIHLFSNAIWMGEMRHETPIISGLNILCMRSFHTSEMGLDTLCEAFVLLVNRFPNVILTIIGNIAPVVREQIERLILHPNVKLLGKMKHEEVLRHINLATMCVIPFKNVPDLAQTHPIKVLEYFSMGKPVVASDIPGIATMIKHGENGLLFRPGDAQDLAEKMATLIEDLPLRERLSKAAARIEQKHNAAVKGRQVLKELETLAGTNR